MDLPPSPSRSSSTMLLIQSLMKQFSMQLGIRQRNQQRRSRDNKYMITEATIVTDYPSVPALSSDRHFCIWESAGFWKPKHKTDSSPYHSQGPTCAMCAPQA